jgi:hypothetical protein
MVIVRKGFISTFLEVVIANLNALEGRLYNCQKAVANLSSMIVA